MLQFMLFTAQNDKFSCQLVWSCSRRRDLGLPEPPKKVAAPQFWVKTQFILSYLGKSRFVLVFTVLSVLWIQIHWIWIRIQDLAQFRSGSRSWSGSGSRVMLSILKEKIKNNLVSWFIFLYLKSYTYFLHFNLFWHVWIRIRILNTDPDPQSSWIRIQYGSGSGSGSTSTTLVLFVFVIYRWILNLIKFSALFWCIFGKFNLLPPGSGSASSMEVPHNADLCESESTSLWPKIHSLADSLRRYWSMMCIRPYPWSQHWFLTIVNVVWSLSKMLCTGEEGGGGEKDEADSGQHLRGCPPCGHRSEVQKCCAPYVPKRQYCGFCPYLTGSWFFSPAPAPIKK